MHVHVLQLKNMVSALFSSGGGMGKTKFFCNKGDMFGWDTIARLWKREEERAERGLMSEVPKLKERYIKRDSWTRLNVAPAKIMQVNVSLPHPSFSPLFVPPLSFSSLPLYSRSHSPSLSLSLSLSHLPLYLSSLHSKTK